MRNAIIKKRAAILGIVLVMIISNIVSTHTIVVNAGSYNEAKPIPSSAVTENQVDSICNVAWSQLGYAGGDEVGAGYYNVYGAELNNNPSYWCALFVTWCARKAGISEEIVPYSASVTTCIQEYAKKGRLYITTDGANCNWEKQKASGWKEGSVKDIKKGDILMIESVGTVADGADHVALAVSDWNGTTVTTVEGNWGNKVVSKERGANVIHAYCRPDYYVPATVNPSQIVGISDIKLESKYWDSFTVSFEVSNSSELKTVSAKAWPNGDKTLSQNVECVKADGRYKVTVNPSSFNYSLWNYTVGITAVGNYNTAQDESFTFNFKDLLSSDKAENVVNITNSQIGYHIDNKNDCKYSAYYNKTPGAGWATYFVKWVMDAAEVEYAPIETAPSTTKTLEWARDNGYYHRINGTSWSYGSISDGGTVEDYKPALGDVVILEGNDNIADGPDTMGIVVGYDYGAVLIATANSSSGDVVTLDLIGYSDEDHIWGYIHPFEKNVIVEPEKYTISYDANGGSISVSPVTKTENVDINITTVQPTREGYQFLGWSTVKSSTSAQYSAGSVFSLNADTVLYAIWKKNVTVSAAVVGYSLTLGDGIAMNVYIDVDRKLLQLDDRYLRISVGDSVYQITDYADAEYETKTVCKYSFEIAAKQMADVITITYVAGENEFTSYTTSVVEYANDLLKEQANESNYETTKDLIYAMLNYGAYAQLYFQYNVDNPANKGLYTAGTNPVENGNISIATKYNVSGTTSNEFMTFMGATLTCNSKTNLTLYFETTSQKSIDEINRLYSISVGGKNDSTIHTSVTGNIFAICISDISFANLDDIYNISIVPENEMESVINMTYSPLTYLKSTATCDDVRLQALGKAMFYLNRAAKAYIK